MLTKFYHDMQSKKKLFLPVQNVSVYWKNYYQQAKQNSVADSFLKFLFQKIACMHARYALFSFKQVRLSVNLHKRFLHGATLEYEVLIRKKKK